MDDLVRWLSQVWDEEEAAARAVHEVDCDSIPREGYHGPFPCDCGVPTRTLARIAADRKILAEHSSEFCQDSACGTEPCRFQRLLASPYADRPGYQESWAAQ